MLARSTDGSDPVSVAAVVVVELQVMAVVGLSSLRCSLSLPLLLPPPRLAQPSISNMPFHAPISPWYVV